MKSWKIVYALFLSCCSFYVFADEAHVEWLPKASLEEKVDALSDVRHNISVLMLQMGERYKNLYWAAQQGKWEFANYQAEEMLELINILQISVPNRVSTASEFVSAVFPMLPNAIAKRDIKKFETAFEKTRTQCMACHAKNNHAFITLPIPKSANSPVLNMK